MKVQDKIEEKNLKDISLEPNFHREKEDIKCILENAIEEFNSGFYTDSAKKFRQIASILQNISIITDKNQKYSEKNSLNDLSGKQWIRHTKSWLIRDGRPSDIPKEIKNHPGSFPPDLAAHFIEFFTKKGQWVMDPFMGIGSTLDACAKLERNCWGLELNKEYSEYAQERVKEKVRSDLTLQVFNEDVRNAKKIWQDNHFQKTDFIITSPPYFNILGTSRGGVESSQKKRIKNGFDEIYSKDSRDLGNLGDYEEFLTSLKGIFANVSEILKENGYICIIVQNFRPKDGIMRPMAWDIATKLKSFLKLKQEFIWLQDQKQLGIWGYPTTYVSNVHHHYCLIFQK